MPIFVFFEAYFFLFIKLLLSYFPSPQGGGEGEVESKI